MIFVSGWAFGSVSIGLVCGFFIGRWYTLANEPKKLRLDRDRTLQAMMKLLSSTDKLNEDVDEHNSVLVEARDDITQIDGDGEIEALQSRLLDNIQVMVESNRKLENELVVSRYTLQQQAQQLDKSKKEARSDALCDLGNRKAFDEALQYLFSCQRVKGQSFGLMLIDVDHFKRINDTFGHSAGDRALISIGEALQKCVRPEDIVCRIGGDEFAILLENTSPEELPLVGKRIRSTIELYDFKVGDESQTTVVTMSMGLTVFQSGDSPSSIFERADHALYRSKKAGRNRLTIETSPVETRSAAPTALPVDPNPVSYSDIKASIENQ